jgi:hypothetical protein
VSEIVVVLGSVLTAVVLGAPIALLLGSGRRGWVALAADAILFGFLTLTLAPTMYGWLGIAGAVITGAAWLACVVAAVVLRRGSLPRPLTRRDGTTALVVAAVVVGVAAVVLRLHVVEFLPWVGDMGAYVNWANEFARTGQLTAGWPPLFPSYLALASWLLGPALTTATIPLAGLALIAALVRLLLLLRVDRWIALLVAAVAAVNGHAIWYSSFPSSESLNAPLFLLWVITVVEGVSARRFGRWAAASGVVMLALGLLRGTGPFLLIPLGLLAVLALVLPDWKPIAARVWWLVSAGVAGAFLSYWYGITRIHAYYVDMQIGELLPDGLMGALKRAGAFTPTVFTALGLALGVLVTAAIALLCGRAARRRERRTPIPAVLGVALAVVLAVGLVATGIVGSASWIISLRMGAYLIPAVVVATVIATSRAQSRRRAAVVLLLATTVTIFYALHTLRLAFHPDHSFFLYWDRYLVSEILPAGLVLTGVALQRIVEIVSRRRPALRRLRSAAVVLPVVALLAGLSVVPQAKTLALVSRDSYMAGDYAFQNALEAHVDDDSTPIIWASTSSRPYPGFFFPNTWMAFARPMAYTSGLDVRRIDNRKNFGPDEVLTEDVLLDEVACSPEGRVLVFELQSTGPDLAERLADGSSLDLRAEGTETGTISLLSQPPLHGGWQHLEFTVEVWSVSASPDGSSASATCPAG